MVAYTRVCVFEGTSPHVLFIRGTCPSTLAGQSVKSASKQTARYHLAQPIFASLAAVAADLAGVQWRESVPRTQSCMDVYPNPFEA